jgi:hypothetical protein
MIAERKTQMLKSENSWKNAVFPVPVLAGSEFKLLGTAFSITDNGIYICARHVVNEVSESDPESP